MAYIRPIVTVNDYEKYIGAAAVERILGKAERLRGMHIANVNSTYYGGGVSEILSSLTLLMDGAGIKTGWRVIQGIPDFFSVTKKMHNALQGGPINLSVRKKTLYEQVVYENALRNHLDDHDLIIIHDPQPLPMVMYYRKKCPWVWRCHVELSRPDPKLWRYLRQFIERYDAVVLSLQEYRQELTVPQVFFQPAIDPFSIKNRDFSEKEIVDRMDYYHIPTDLPLVVQVSRFDRWKDPEGVIAAFKIARREVPCTLVLLGDIATDDPEGARVYESLYRQREERIIVLSQEDTALVNALQRRAAVVVQKSTREGFGLTVTEAMWKGKAVIGGDTGGIRCQIRDGFNGFLVSSVTETAERIVRLLRDRKLRERLGANARETVRRKYLMTRSLEEYLDLFHSFSAQFTLHWRTHGQS